MNATHDAERIARELTRNEHTVLLSLPVLDRGGMPEELWWAYASLLDQGLATSADSRIVLTPLGAAVRRSIERR